ncbi:MAG: hypothetical protein AB1498_10540 [bacterium]
MRKKNKNLSSDMNHIIQHSTGFSYYVNDDHLLAYHAWPIEKRLEWLYAVNLLRKGLPSRIKKIQDKFRSGQI